MTDRRAGPLLPASVWMVLGGAVGAAVGSGAGESSVGLGLGVVLGAGAGYVASLILSRRGGPEP